VGGKTIASGRSLQKGLAGVDDRDPGIEAGLVRHKRKEQPGFSVRSRFPECVDWVPGLWIEKLVSDPAPAASWGKYCTWVPN